MNIKNAIFAFVFTVFSIASIPSYSQSTLAEIQAALGGKTSELEQVDALLADPDPNRRLAAIELLIASGNPVFVNRAKEVGLFSSDPAMRSVALKATLDFGGPFRMQLVLTEVEEEKSKMIKWLNGNGTWDTKGTKGTFTFFLAFEPKFNCWKFSTKSNVCAVILTGETIELLARYGSGSFTLNNEGLLIGFFRNTGHSSYIPVPAIIDLTE